MSQETYKEKYVTMRQAAVNEQLLNPNKLHIMSTANDELDKSPTARSLTDKSMITKYDFFFFSSEDLQ